MVCHNDRADLKRCLDSLYRRPPATPHELVVVDNASTDGSPEMLHRDRPDVLVLRNPENLGFSRAVNRGLRATASELVLLLNPDTLPSGQAVDALVAELRRHGGVVAVGPRVVGADGRPEISWWWHLHPLSELRKRRLAERYERRDPGAMRRVAALTGRSRDVDWVTGACLLARRRPVVAAGLMDGGYFLYFDDVDLCAALRARGGRIRFVAEVEIVHLCGRTVARMPERKARAYRESQLRFYRKHHPLWHPLLRLYLRAKGELPG